MASHRFGINLSRDNKMNDEEFLRHFRVSQAHIQKSSFGFVPITNDLEMYLFEAYCAMELDTHQWNSFRTH